MDARWSSEDEFDKQLRLDKENVHPNLIVKSPLQNKLKEMNFFNSDFENESCKESFASLVKDVEPYAFEKCPANIKRPNSPKKGKVPYKKLRVERKGMTMFEMVKATDSPEKVVIFLQEKGCLPTEKVCPDCNEQMKFVQRGDKIQSLHFRCWQRHLDGSRCNNSPLRNFVNEFTHKESEVRDV